MARKRLHDAVMLAVCALAWSAALCGCASMQFAKGGADFAMPTSEAAGMPPTLSETVKAAGGESESLAPDLQKRMIVYNAALELSVDRITHSLEQVKALAQQAGGYVHQMTTNSAVIRVPATKFHEVVGSILQLGRVRRKQVTGTDVTEQFRDLRIRLDNAERIRTRLVELLKKATKVEETLKVEKELGRVTTEIELLKGKIRHMEHNVAFSTVTVRMSSTLPQDQFDQSIPFRWVNQLGEDLARGDTGRPHHQQGTWRLVAIALPDSYVKYYEWDWTTKAMSADGVVVQVRRLANYRGGTTAFWHGLVRRALVDDKHFALAEEKTLAVHGGSARVLALTKVVGAQKHAYLVAIAATKDHVYVVEAWGHEEKVAQARADLDAAIETLRLGGWRTFLWHLF